MWYQTQGTTVRTAGALMPVLAPTPRATTYTQVVIVGQPGTMGIPAPKPAGLPMVSQTRGVQPSWGAPDVRYPSLYWTTADNMHPPVSLLRTNDMPVPATSSYRLAGPKMRARPAGGPVALMWPPTVSRFNG